MPIATIGDAIDQASLELSDLRDGVAIPAATIVHRRLCALYPELCRQVLTIPLTAETSEYVIPDAVFQIEGATFTPASGDAVAIMDETVESLRAANPAWRVRGADDWSGGDVAMYVSSRVVDAAQTLVVGFYPPPDAQSALGTLDLYVSMGPDNDVQREDSILPGLHSSRVYVEGILYHSARVIRPDAAANYKAVYDAELKESGAIVRTRVEGAKAPDERNVRAQ
jgi:hypothetical protein